MYVCVLEAKDLPVKDSYVKLKLGKFKSKTRILRHICNPVWNEEFVFKVHDHNNNKEDVLVVSNDGESILLGEVRIQVAFVASQDKQTLPPTWFSLETPKSGEFFNKYCGKILLSVSLHGKGRSYINHTHSPNSTVAIED